MKILHVTKKYPNALGGDAVVVSNLEKQQIKAGHKVVILTSNCDAIKDRKNIYKFGLKDTPAMLDRITIKRLISLVVLSFRAYKVLETERPDVIHTHSVDMAFFVSFAARHHRIPIVHSFHIVTFYGEDQSLFRKKTELFLIKKTRPKKITAPNIYDVEKLQKALSTPVLLLSNGIELEFWRKNKKTKKSKPFTFITVGRLEKQKGVEYLIRAVANLKNTGTKFKVIIAGEGSLETNLMALSESLGVDNIVEFVGESTLTEVLKLYNSSEVAVFPSLYETTPLTLLEAWAVQLPTIMTPVGILKESKNNSLTQLVKIQDVESLASAMEELFLNKRKRLALAAAAYKEVQHYSWEKVFKEADTTYRQVLV